MENPKFSHKTPKRLQVNSSNFKFRMILHHFEIRITFGTDSTENAEQNNRMHLSLPMSVHVQCSSCSVATFAFVYRDVDDDGDSCNRLSFLFLSSFVQRLNVKSKQMHLLRRQFLVVVEMSTC